MDDVGRYLSGFIISIVLILLAMIFSAFKAIINSLSESKIKKLSEEQKGLAQKLLNFKNNQSDFSIKATINSIICTFFASLISSYLIYELILNTILLENSNQKALVFLLITVPVIWIATIFGITIPKMFYSKKPTSFSLSLTGIFSFLMFMFNIFSFIPFIISKGIAKIMRIDESDEDITEEEIRNLVDVGNEKGTIELSEREMINNIFEFDDRTAGDVMTHRTELITCSITDKITGVLNLAVEEGFSRIPVLGDGIDDIAGILYVKDLLCLIGKDNIDERTISEFMRPVIYVPESTRCRMLFREFTERKTHMAVIVDEYGGTAGIVTMEDLLESIVGNIQDEYDQEEEEIRQIDENTYYLEGGLNIEEVEKLFNIELESDENYDTIGGLISNTLGRIPNGGETPSIEIQNILFTVLIVEDRRILRVKAEIIHDEPEEI